jgi:hypothetical protein
VKKLGTGCGSESWGGEGSPFIGSWWIRGSEEEGRQSAGEVDF